MPKRVADKAEHDEGADAEPAAAHRKAKAAATADSAAAVIATIVDVAAATEVIVTHGAFPYFPCIATRRSGPADRRALRRRKICIPLINNPPGKNCLA